MYRFIKITLITISIEFLISGCVRDQASNPNNYKKKQNKKERPLKKHTNNRLNLFSPI